MTSPGPTRELLVLRHGKASADPRWATDFERPLAPRGERDAPAVGRWLAAQDLAPDRVLASTAARAAATARAVVAELGDDGAPIDWHDDLYLAPVTVLLAHLSRLPDDCARALVVGHNPGLEELVTRLSGSHPGAADGGVPFPTCALAVLRFDGSWAGLRLGTGELLALRRPREVGTDA